MSNRNLIKRAEKATKDEKKMLLRQMKIRKVKGAKQNVL